MRTSQLRRRLLTAALVVGAAVAGTTAAAPATAAATTCIEQGGVTVGTDADAFLTTIVDCSSQGTVAQIARVLGQSDAYRLHLLAGKDRFIANDQWVAWIDTHSAPGILRGLWEVDSSATFVGNQRPGLGGHQSLLAIGDQYVTGAADTMGYMGLHVEIWTRPEGQDGADYFTYRHVGTDVATYTTAGGQTSASYGMQLYSRLTGGPTFVGVSGSASRVMYEVIYTMTSTAFHIETRLSADTPVATQGDLGGLLLLTTQACHPGTASCASDIPGHSLHVLEGITNSSAPAQCGPGDGQLTVLSSDGTRAAWDLHGNGYSAGQLSTDRLCIEQVVVPSHQDRALNAFTLRVAPGSGVGMTVTPGYFFNDPGETQGHRQAFVYHYSAPAAVGRLRPDGVVGRGSLDVVYQPTDSTTSLAFGGNRGYRTFAVDINH